MTPSYRAWIHVNVRVTIVHNNFTRLGFSGLNASEGRHTLNRSHTLVSARQDASAVRGSGL
jgi:hypothetical protein